MAYEKPAVPRGKILTMLFLKYISGSQSVMILWAGSAVVFIFLELEKGGRKHQRQIPEGGLRFVSSFPPSPQDFSDHLLPNLKPFLTFMCPYFACTPPPQSLSWSLVLSMFI